MIEEVSMEDFNKSRSPKVSAALAKYNPILKKCPNCTGGSDGRSLMGTCMVASAINRHEPCSGGAPGGCDVYLKFRNKDLMTIEPAEIMKILGLKPVAVVAAAPEIRIA